MAGHQNRKKGAIRCRSNCAKFFSRKGAVTIVVGFSPASASAQLRSAAPRTLRQSSGYFGGMEAAAAKWEAWPREITALRETDGPPMDRRHRLTCRS